MATFPAPWTEPPVRRGTLCPGEAYWRPRSHRARAGNRLGFSSTYQQYSYRERADVYQVELPPGSGQSLAGAGPLAPVFVSGSAATPSTTDWQLPSTFFKTSRVCWEGASCKLAATGESA